MTKEQAVRYFGTQKALADALDITQPSVAEWGEYPPELQQLRLHRLTNGELRAEREVLKKFGAPQLERAA